jgi:hypothetical protein
MSKMSIFKRDYNRKKIKGGKYIYSSIGEKICHFRQSVVYQHFNRHES